MAEQYSIEPVLDSSDSLYILKYFPVASDETDISFNHIRLNDIVSTLGITLNDVKAFVPRDSNNTEIISITSVKNDLKGWNMQGCPNLEEVDVSGFYMNNMLNVYRAFRDCTNLKTLKGIKGSISFFAGNFFSSTSATVDTLTISDCDFTCNSSHWLGDANCKNLVFKNCKVKLAGNTSEFACYLRRIENIDCRGLTIEPVTEGSYLTLDSLFNNSGTNSESDELVITGLNLSNTTRVGRSDNKPPFANIPVKLKFKDCDFSNIQDGDLSGLFSGFTGSELDISNIKFPSEITNLRATFSNNNNLITIYASKDLYVEGVTDTTLYTFNGNTNLVGGNGTKYSELTFTDNKQGQYAVIDKEGQTGLLTYKEAVKTYDIVTTVTPSSAITVKETIIDGLNWSVVFNDPIAGYSLNYYAFTTPGERGQTGVGKKWSESDPYTISGTFIKSDEGTYTLDVYMTSEANPGGKNPGGSSGGGSGYNSGENIGGDGSGNITSDIIDVADLPSKEVLDSGFISLWQPTESNLNALYDRLWQDSTDSFLDYFKEKFANIVANPLDLILSLQIYPISTGKVTSKTLKVLGWSSGITMPCLTSQYLDVEFGTVDIKPVYGTFLDYAPYTEVYIYLPFIGETQLSVNEVMGKTLKVKYRIDYMNGKASALVYAGDSLIYQTTAYLAYQIPITSGSRDYLGMITNIASAISSGNGGDFIKGAENALGALQPTVSHSGQVGDSAGYISCLYPYIRLEYPEMYKPYNYGKYKGYTFYETKQLGGCNGYTKIADVHLEGFTRATREELQEIEQLLREGVIL